MVNIKKDIDIQKLFNILKRKDILIIIIIIFFTLLTLRQGALKRKKLIVDLSQSLMQEDKKAKLLKDIQDINKKIIKDKKIFKEVEANELINKIATQANKIGLRIVSIEPMSKYQEKKVTILPIRLTLNGNYHFLGKFISSLENFDEFIEITRINFTATDSQDQREDFVALNIEIDLNYISLS